MSNKKYLYIDVTKPNALLAKFLSKWARDKFCSNCFNNFQTNEKRKNHEASCKNHNHFDIIIPK